MTPEPDGPEGAEAESLRHQFTGFSGESLRRIAEDIAKIVGQPGAMIQVRGTGKHMTIKCVCDNYEGEEINDSFLCPPRCRPPKEP